MENSYRETEDLVRLSFFVEIGKAISRARTINQTLSAVMEHIGEIFAPLHWSLLLRDANTGELTFTMVIGKNAAKLQGQRLPRGEGLAGWIAETGQAAIVEDVDQDPRFSKRLDTETGFKTNSIIGVPLRSSQKVFGVIELINKIDERPFTPIDLKILTTIADFAAIAIEKAYFLGALKRMASVDALTGVFNRGEFHRLVSRELERARRYNLPLACLMADVDDFKHINDAYGHLAGDAVLQSVAEILTNSTRKCDSVCRYGGDEFVVIMPNTSREQAREARARILDALDARNAKAAVPFRISIGLHCALGDERDDFLQVLDQDLYREKEKKLQQTIEHVDEHLQDLLDAEGDLPTGGCGVGKPD